MAERTPASHGKHQDKRDGKRDKRRRERDASVTRSGEASGSGAAESASGAADEGLRGLLAGLTAVRDGDLSVRLPEGTDDVQGEIAGVYNDMVDRLSLLTAEVTRVADEVGGQGLLGGRAGAPRASGVWRELSTGVNTMADNLTSQVRSIAQVATAVARGDLTQKIRVDARGEILELKETINTMVDRLSSFAEEVTRVAREVGTEGKLGGQARVRGVSGTWKDLTDNVNSMADNLTNQVRNIAQVTTAVAQGDLTSRIDVSARGEILELKTTINTMVDQLSSFAAEVTRVAREVGTEGKLGGQAEVEGVSGTWMRLTENVNELAGNLTRQVRAIAEVTSAVAEGDLTRSIAVEAPGEVGELRDNINAMVESLRATTRANEEQDWLQTNLARITALLQGTRGLPEIAELIMAEVPPLVSAQYGAFFLAAEPEPGPGRGPGTVPGGSPDGEAGGPSGAAPPVRPVPGPDLVMAAAYGLPVADGGPPRRFRTGEGLVGQAARNRRVLLVDPVPKGYATVSSAVGTGEPAALIVLPIVVEDQVLGAVELASLEPFGAMQRDFLDRFVVSAGAVLSSLVANLRTDELLAQSRSLADELRSRTLELQARQRELQRSNAELQEQAELLAERNQDIESKNRVIEQARQELEARAQQLTRTSMYKSEFLANMSHELRTPLNSLLILARLLAQNPEGNLTEKQVDYAEVIHSAGSDLLQLINDILDLSKVEAGKMEVRREPFALSQLLESLEATFAPVADQQGLDFAVTVGPGVPERLTTDEARLRQVLRNLLSNALKFTEEGEVSLTVEHTPADEVPAGLRDGRPVLAFRVTDTGVGIPADRLRHIFEAFQQGDGTTAREYGGTGLGLSISREVATLLGGTIEVESSPGKGSRFTFHLPERPAPADPAGTGADGPDEDGGTTGTTGDDAGVPGVTGVTGDAGVTGVTDGAKPAGGAEDAREAAPAGAGAEPATTVLVVDDDDRNVFALTQVLEAHGLRVLTADGGRRAVELLAAHDEVRLVLMDVMMAGMDGYRAIEEIRRMPGRAGVPVIVVTAKAMPGDRARALEAGADDYLAKPVDEDELLVRIRRRLAD
ncbi:HAMP domain-containing protein [Streptomyces sp. NPDC015232]|uniref:HAMP domain-containing protein n=1 Tax=unclassified Streptomyces TaxID=2593676 RepID=UPI0036F6AD7F